jgi:uracil-DNA glycosylase
VHLCRVRRWPVCLVMPERLPALAATADLFGVPGPDRLSVWEPRDWPVDASWTGVLEHFWRSPTGQSLQARIEARLAQGAVIFPPAPFRALALTPLHEVRVLILGQDPYHGPGQAHGLAFSVSPGVRVPPSLRNIFKELQRDLGQHPPASGCLQAWAQRGVLLLNTCLTVEEGRAASHAGWGWESLTDALVDVVASTSPACVYMLWGIHAQSKKERIEACTRLHGGAALILASNHPSPLSANRGPAPFLGCGHFSAAQAWLAKQGRELSWSL